MEFFELTLHDNALLRARLRALARAMHRLNVVCIGFSLALARRLLNAGAATKAETTLRTVVLYGRDE